MFITYNRMRGKKSKKTFLIIFNACIIVVAGILCFFAFNKLVKAQTNNECYLNRNGCEVVLLSPASGANMGGQTQVHVGILGLTPSNVASIALQLYRSSDTDPFSTMLCNSWNSVSPNYWSAYCDTMAITETQPIFIQVHALDTDGSEIPLKLSTSTSNTNPVNNPKFGSFYVMNMFGGMIPSSVTTLSGFQNFRAYSTGDLAVGQLEFVPYTNPGSVGHIIELVRDSNTADPNHNREWFFDDYNTADIPNGNYSVFFRYRPLLSSTFIRSRGLVFGPLTVSNSCPYPDGEQRYDCGPWESCLNNISRRTCNLKIGCPSSSQPVATSQSCGSLPNCTGTNQWTCTAWDPPTCTSGTTQTRTCRAPETCIPTEVQPAYSQTCPNNTLPTCSGDSSTWWTCDNWSPVTCTVGNQTRTCRVARTDCMPPDTSRPTEIRACSNTALPTCPSTPSPWSCTAWTPVVCSSGSNQTRSCTVNRTDCLPAAGTRPVESQPCTGTGETTIPAPSITDPVSGSVHKNTLFAVKGKTLPGYSVRVTIKKTIDVVDGSVNAGTDGNYYYLLKTPLSPGSYPVYVQAISPDGKASAPSNIVTVQLVKPTVGIIEPISKQIVFGDSQRILASVEYDDPEMTVEFYLRPTDSTANETLLCSGTRNDQTQPKSWNCTWKTTQYTDGNYYLMSRVKIRTGLVYASPIVPVTVQQTVNATSQQPTNSNISETDTAAAEQAVDSDGDGLPDSLESTLGTDPNNIDSDGDGVSDGIEANSLKTNPLEANPTAKLPTQSSAVTDQLEKISFDEPIKSGTLVPDKLKVKTVENYSPKTGQNNLVISGVGPPNTTVYIYIYSTPVVVTTKTDESGNFTYTLDKNLADGRHEVYVTVNDQTGKVQEKSSPLAFFVRKAVAVSETDYLRGDVNVSSSGDTSMSRYLVIALSAIAAVVVVLLGARYLTKKQKIQ